MPGNETKKCNEEEQALKDANGELTEARGAYENAVEAANEAMSNYQWGFAAMVVGAVAGMASGVAIPAVVGGVGAAEVALEALKYAWNEAARELIDAKTDYIFKQGLQDQAQKALDHCRGDGFSFEMGEPTVSDDEDDLPEGDEDDMPEEDEDDMPEGDDDLPDFMPDGSDDLDDF